MTFLMIPKDLFKNPLYNNVSPESKLLYGFLADRSKLSEKNGSAWMDKNNEYFIYYSQTEVMERFCCGHEKASRLMRELENVGLIKRSRQGLGKPYRLVVKAVSQCAYSKDNGDRNFGLPDLGKTADNNTEHNNNDMNYTDNLFSKRSLVESLIKANISYDVLLTETDPDVLKCVVDVMVDTLCTSSKTVRICGEAKDIADVHQRFMSLSNIHLHYVLDRLNAEKTTIISPKGFLLKHLYYATQEMDIYYLSKLTHDNTIIGRC